MTSGSRTSETAGGPGTRAPARRRWLRAGAALAALAWAGCAAAQAPRGFDLQALMSLLAGRGSGEARFSEERSVAGLDSVLRASGTLSFTAPDRFERVTLEPRREAMAVVGQQLRLERGGRVRVLTLDAVPELAALIEGLRATLGGDAATLARHFETRVTGSASRWTLALTPRDAQLARQVRGLQLEGNGGDLRSVELRMSNGDRSLMLIEPVPAAPAARPSAGAASR